VSEQGLQQHSIGHLGDSFTGQRPNQQHQSAEGEWLASQQKRIQSHQALPTVLEQVGSSGNSRVIGCEDHSRNDLYCVGWDVKLCSVNQSCKNYDLERRPASNLSLNTAVTTVYRLHLYVSFFHHDLGLKMLDK